MIGQPAWNYKLMSCGLWLALVPTLLILVGIFRSGIGGRRESVSFRRCLQLAVVTITIFISAIVYVYLKLPAYSVAKASYMLGTAPFIGILAATGFDWLSRIRKVRIVAGGILFCWAVTAYFTFFVF